MPLETPDGVKVNDPNLGVKGQNPEITAPNWTGAVSFCANTNAECLNDPSDFTDPTVPSTDSTALTSLFPIYFPPSVVIDAQGNKHVIFVTGDRREPSDPEKFGKLY
ncbi:MAG: hypothetical protein GTN99_00535, partial [Candidatus Dadabacteria bacterium]|nr:hypothetical protein [Candidatus Dadabacteria bacterium]